MSVFDPKQVGTQTQTSAIDPSLRQAYLSNIDFANQLAARPYQQFGGPRVAGFSPDQNAAFQGVRNMQGGAEPFFNQAGNSFRNLMNFQGRNVRARNFLGGNIGAYQNPYTSQVIDQSMMDIERARQLQQQQNAASAVSRRAFGGSRQAVFDAENNRNFLDQMARTSAGLRAQGFDTAAGLMQNDMNRDMQAQQLNQQNAISSAGIRSNASSNFLNAGMQRQQQRLNDINALMQTGGMQQQQAQRNLDTAYGDFQQQFNYPLQQQAIRNAALSVNLPNLGMSSSSPIYGNNLSSALGVLGAVNSLTGGGQGGQPGIVTQLANSAINAAKPAVTDFLGGALNTGKGLLSDAATGIKNFFTPAPKPTFTDYTEFDY